jgi:beta-phosphoglucomutase-like phosphatase (HAD superfamily)
MILEVDARAKGLIFDLDGTLANSLPVHMECWEAVCSGFGYHFSRDKMLEMTGMPTIHFAEYVKEQSGCPYSAKEIAHMKQAEFHKRVEQITILDPVFNLVLKYHGKLPMTIGTGGSRKSVELMLDWLDIRDYFGGIVTANDVERHKPEPDTFLKCAEIMGIAPKFCQVFEDGDMGIKAAITAGMLVTDVRPFVVNT